MMESSSLRNAKAAQRRKDWVKSAWGAFFYYGGFFHLLRLWNNLRGRRLTILLYHRVTDRNIGDLKESLPVLFVSEANFQKQLLFIKEWFHVIGFEDLDQYEKAGPLPRNSLIITFDDGYEDNYSVAYRILKQHGLKACFFIPANRVGTEEDKSYWWDRAYSHFQRKSEIPVEKADSDRDTLFHLYQELGSHFFAELNSWDTRKIESALAAAEGKETHAANAAAQENRLLNWSQILEMGRGMEFGSHTCNHFNLCTLPGEEMEMEIRESRIRIEKNLARKVLAFSYPAGNYNQDTSGMVEKSGYRFAVSTEKGVNSLKAKFHLRRINIWEGTAAGSGGRFSKGFFAYKTLGY
jgi:peptidoglycan/xylan/chitin deacetylase (PgdA/CDA1 family)